MCVCMLNCLPNGRYDALKKTNACSFSLRNLQSRVSL